MNRDLLKKVNAEIKQLKVMVYGMTEDDFAILMHPVFGIMPNTEKPEKISSVEEKTDFLELFLSDTEFAENYLKNQKGKIPKKFHDKLTELQELEKKVSIRFLPYTISATEIGVDGKSLLSFSDKKIRELADMFLMPDEEFLKHLLNWLDGIKEREEHEKSVRLIISKEIQDEETEKMLEELGDNDDNIEFAPEFEKTFESISEEEDLPLKVLRIADLRKAIDKRAKEIEKNVVIVGLN